MSKVLEITPDEFEAEVLRSPGRVAVNFYTDSSPCRILSPVLACLAEEGEAKIVAVNADRNERLAREHGITAVPTVILFNRGREVRRLVGLRWLSELRDDLVRKPTSPTDITPQQCLNFLLRQEEYLVETMLDAGLENLVGVVADLRDADGRRLAFLLGTPQSTIDAQVAACTDKTFPWFRGVVARSEIERVICEIDPHAPDKMHALWRDSHGPGWALAICIAGGHCVCAAFDLRPARMMGLAQAD